MPAAIAMLDLASRSAESPVPKQAARLAPPESPQRRNAEASIGRTVGLDAVDYARLCLAYDGLSRMADRIGFTLVVWAEAHARCIMHVGVQSARRRRPAFLHARVDLTAIGQAKTREPVQLILRGVQVLRSAGASGVESPNRDGGDPGIV
jgi:hypothetical protein